MLKSEYVITKTNNRNYKKFKNIGYIFNINEDILVNVNDLNRYSRSLVDVECDVCKINKKLKYCDYTKNISKYNIYTCSTKCSNIKYKNTCLKNFGTEYPLQNKDIKEKLSKYFVDKYGVKHPSILSEFELKKQNTNVERYGVKHQMFLEENISKIKNTKFYLYGDENYNNKDKLIKTCIEKYGVSNPMKFYDIFRKQMISSFKSLLDVDSNLYYQSKYELHFIKYCIKNNINIEEGLTISYYFKNRKRKYYSDFYLPDYNLICEIKSSYTMNCDYDENIAKKECSINSGYNFLFIIDKDYNELEKIIKLHVNTVI